jgi:hypothetical protein
MAGLRGKTLVDLEHTKRTGTERQETESSILVSSDQRKWTPAFWLTHMRYQAG